jgi:SAM-dependent methyltransferase
MSTPRAPDIPNYWDSLDKHSLIDEIWMSHRLVRERINRRVSGDPGVWSTTWLRDRIAGRLPLARTMSIGCGTGNFERDIVRLGIVARVTGIELSPICVEVATREAAAAGYSGMIDYRVDDAWKAIEEARDLDAIFFHASLHHFDHLPEMAKLLRAALRPGGLLYLDEYVGPSRDEWRLRDLALLNFLYYRLPRTVRRVGRIRAPVNREDPTEGVESSAILPAIRSEFDILEQRDYGGNLASVIYANLRRPSHVPPSPQEDFDEAIAFLLDVEDLMLAHPRISGAASFHTVLLATPKRP